FNYILSSFLLVFSNRHESELYQNPSRTSDQRGVHPPRSAPHIPAHHARHCRRAAKRQTDRLQGKNIPTRFHNAPLQPLTRMPVLLKSDHPPLGKMPVLFEVALCPSRQTCQLQRFLGHIIEPGLTRTIKLETPKPKGLNPSRWSGLSNHTICIGDVTIHITADTPYAFVEDDQERKEPVKAEAKDGVYGGGLLNGCRLSGNSVSCLISFSRDGQHLQSGIQHFFAHPRIPFFSFLPPCFSSFDSGLWVVYILEIPESHSPGKPENGFSLSH
ncbi:hypothetical protein C8J56DRAFT_1100579, partial [Mycena floridula]